MFTDFVGYFAGLCLAISFLPQVVKTIQLRSAADVSMGMLTLTLASAVGYEFYAFKLGLTPVVVMNGVFLALVLTEIFLKLRFDGWKKTGNITEQETITDLR